MLVMVRASCSGRRNEGRTLEAEETHRCCQCRLRRVGERFFAWVERRKGSTMMDGKCCNGNREGKLGFLEMTDGGREPAIGDVAEAVERGTLGDRRFMCA